MAQTDGDGDFYEVLALARRDISVFRAGLIAHVAGMRRDDEDSMQHVIHGLAWYATLLQAFEETCEWLATLRGGDGGGGAALLAGRILAAELLAECRGGIAMHQLETIRLETFGLPESVLATFQSDPIQRVIRSGCGWEVRRRLVDLLVQTSDPAMPGLEGAQEAQAMAEVVARFASAEIAPHAHGWHMTNTYIPESTIAGLADMGVFGMSVPMAFGGADTDKVAMCAVTEELSRAFLGAGSLGTRAEIAAELVGRSGRPEQRERYLPGIVRGEILTAAAFTEAGAGSDLGAVRCRAKRDGDEYVIEGTKIWITHAARADLLTLLVRTDPDAPGYRGLSMLLVEKPRGDDSNPFPADGMSGSEIDVIGYRGMKEYEIGFEGFRVPASALLGDREGQGFRQLMQTFETARIQTAARSIGVARAAFDLALHYARERRQFGKPLIAFARVSDKLAGMYSGILAARLLTFAAARAKDAGRRCDLEAGMAKLFAARVAWAAADGTVQIHGGAGFAVELPASRLLCDARILSIFEGAAEIQAQIIARRLLTPQ